MSNWPKYFAKHRGRAPSPLYRKALIFVAGEGAGEGADKCAIDLGCGAGIETADLLSRGWSVVAVDREESAIEAIRAAGGPNPKPSLGLIHAAFEELSHLPPADFIYAYHSLPFCRAAEFKRFWGIIRNSLKPGGIFAGTFFGLQDDWVKAGSVAGNSAEQIEEYLSGLSILFQEEVDRIGPTALQGPKRWHYVSVIAKRPAF